MIIKRLDGSYEVVLYGKDTERFRCRTEAEAIEHYIGMTVFLENCPREEVVVPPIEDRGEWPVVVIKEGGGFEVAHHQVQVALNLLASRGDHLRPGYQYRLVIRLEEEDGEAPFSGEGI